MFISVLATNATYPNLQFVLNFD